VAVILNRANLDGVKKSVKHKAEFAKMPDMVSAGKKSGKVAARQAGKSNSQWERKKGKKNSSRRNLGQVEGRLEGVQKFQGMPNFLDQNPQNSRAIDICKQWHRIKVKLRKKKDYFPEIQKNHNLLFLKN